MFVSLHRHQKNSKQMKKTIIFVMGSMLLLSSCGTYTGQGAYVGGTFGSLLGSAIGGISGGWRGEHVGSIVGLAGGAVVGAAIGSAADQKAQERVAQYERQRNSDRQYGDNRQYGDSRQYDHQPDGGYDDRIDFDAPGPRETTYNNSVNDAIVIRNARIVDGNHDGVLRAGEECKVMFEIMNRSDKVIFDVQPTVYDVTGNKNIRISPDLHVESIAPKGGVRYTANILADKKLKNGEVVIRVAVKQGNREIASQVKEIVVPTSRK